MTGDALSFDEFVSFNLAILVYFLGVRLNKKIPFLRHYNIPEPVSGGLLVAMLALIVYLAFGKEIGFSLQSRDYLLFVFFTAIGLNARFTDLAKGGKPLLILLFLTVGYMLLQNAVGTGIAAALGLPTGFGLLGGTISLVGGHGTAIAWGPKLVEDYGVMGAVEIGAATATLGLIAASLLGGPVGNYLIERKGAKPDPNRPEEAPMIGIETEREAVAQVTHTGLMRSLLVLNIAIALGVGLQEALVTGIGLDLPIFVCCLFCGIVLSNTVPLVFKNMTWPARSQSLAVLSDLALGIFLTMSLMSLQLWTIAGLAGPMMLILATQIVVAALFIILVVYPMMGRNYNAAVLGAGFAGFALGATPTAIANMTAVTKRYGPATQAFLILPLVSAFFVDLANAAIIILFLGG
ncbi:sodium/glutamate symporter [Roseibium porphyridii]|uniref:Sodium/glutamate symporter n=1 Tax=Roseibium porphyridii TaxID=2866279 RepID=A0ABY8F098_9HYPH|nr:MULTISPECIES: sodium/glutamate symporter [Stappiaceae]QFT33607.1 Sodium/glutamate symport carrier protein [Labrenzia sp. THAF82]WFE88871.1 sodium/glutamate symporter [Roseibium sp. KMA01]